MVDIYFFYSRKKCKHGQTLENSAQVLKCLRTVNGNVLKLVSLCLKVILVSYAY